MEERMFSPYRTVTERLTRLRGAALLVLRVVVGWLFILHAIMKFQIGSAAFQDRRRGSRRDVPGYPATAGIPPNDDRKVMGMDLTGKAAIVTGGGRGLGLAYARALADAGAAVVVNDADGAAATTAVKMITGAGGAAVAEVGAVGTTEVAERLVRRAVDEFGGLDTLVTNAGILRDRVLWKMTDDDFDSVVAVHLRGTFTCVRAAVRHLRDQGRGGRVVVIGSPAGQRGNFGQTNYSAAKAAIVGMVRTWAQECAKAEITVNAVVPVAATAMTRTIPAFAPLVTAFEERGEAFPDWLRKGAGFGTPEDAAGLVVFLASDAAAGITGQVIGIGGDKLSLWSHPSEIAVAYAESGWSSDAIAATWASSLGQHAQTYGIQAPVS